jgi:hypothetical protein
MFAIPELMEATAADLAGLGSTIGEANAAAAAPTTSVVAAAQDEVSTAIAALFSSHAQQFQALSAKAAALHGQFVQALAGGAASYVRAEAANVLGLMVGAPAGASGAAAALSKAAAATPAALDDLPLGTIFNFLFGLGAPQHVSFLGQIADKTESFLSQLNFKLETDAKAGELAARAMRVQRIVANGLKLIGQDGAQLYTDGREIVAIGGRYPFDLYTEGYLYQYRRVLDAWGWTDQTMQSVFRSEIIPVFRGEGLVQHALQRVGNEFYHIETDAQGQIISRILTTEEEAKETLLRISDLSLLKEIQKDVFNAIDQAEQASRQLAEQASTQLAEQALKEAHGVIEEARQAFFRVHQMGF